MVVVLPFGGDERARAFKTRLYENVYYGAKARERHTLQGVSSNCFSFSSIFGWTKDARKKQHTEHHMEWISLSFSSRSFLINSDGIFLLSFCAFFPFS